MPDATAFEALPEFNVRGNSAPTGAKNNQKGGAGAKRAGNSAANNAN